MEILSFLMDGINSCMGWFWDLMTKSNTWGYYLTSFIIVCLGSLLVPFVGYRVRVGSSDTARKNIAVDKYGNKVKISNDEKWLM